MLPNVDVIIISAANNSSLRQETETAISSLFESETEIAFHVVVIESNRDVQYRQKFVTTVHPTVPFGYHRYLNIGRKLGAAEYVCLCNNDLLFEKGWATAIIAAMNNDPALLSASPYCRRSHPAFKLKPHSGNYEGYEVRKHLPGWCIFQRRAIYDQIGDLDEQFVFWYADDDYGKTLEQHQIKHQLITGSIVNHRKSQTLNSRPSEEKQALTRAQKQLFDAKWASK